MGIIVYKFVWVCSVGGEILELHCQFKRIIETHCSHPRCFKSKMFILIAVSHRQNCLFSNNFFRLETQNRLTDHIGYTLLIGIVFSFTYQKVQDIGRVVQTFKLLERDDSTRTYTKERPSADSGQAKVPRPLRVEFVLARHNQCQPVHMLKNVNQLLW